MRVREETPADRVAVAELTEAAFGRPAESRLVEAIRGSEEYVAELSLVAELEGRVVAHAMLSRVTLGRSGRRALVLAPVSVRPESQRRGVGSALVRELLARAEERGEPLVIVLGHPSFYPRFGFRRASELGIVAPHPEIPDEAWMAIPLGAYDPALRGRVVFPAAFDEESLEPAP